MSNYSKNIFFHGTEKKNLNKILKKGLYIKYGRATFTKNLRTEQFGYYPINKKEDVLVKKYIIAIFSYDKQLLTGLNLLFKDILNTKINNQKIKEHIFKFKKIFSKKQLQIIKPTISIDDLANLIIIGMMNNLILREIRANYISYLVLNGWKIHNPGQEPCKRWLKDKEGLIKSTKEISKIINEKFINSNIRKEFLLREQKLLSKD